VVFTPGFAPGFSLSIDYYSIEVSDLISTIGANNSIQACYFGGDATACSRLHRSAAGQLWVGGGFVDDFNVNIGGVEVSGVDVVSNYRFNLDAVGLTDMGSMSLNFDHRLPIERLRLPRHTGG